MATKLSLLEFTIASHWLDSSQFHHILIDNFVDSLRIFNLLKLSQSMLMIFPQQRISKFVDDYKKACLKSCGF